MNGETPEYIPTRSSLLSRLKDWDDADSWRDFFQTYWKLIYNTALRAGLSDTEAQDVVQDTVISVSKKMPDFKYDAGRGSFKGWLLQLTGWRIKNQLKKRSRHERLPDLEAEAGEELAEPATADLAAFWEREWELNLIDAAIRRIKQRVPPRQHEIFYLLVVKELPAQQVAATLKVRLPQVYLAKHRVSLLVRREVARLRREMV